MSCKHTRSVLLCSISCCFNISTTTITVSHADQSSQAVHVNITVEVLVITVLHTLTQTEVLSNITECAQVTATSTTVHTKVFLVFTLFVKSAARMYQRFHVHIPLETKYTALASRSSPVQLLKWRDRWRHYLCSVTNVCISFEINLVCIKCIVCI